ncbi:MAG: hypothetical protein ACR2J4_06570 [Deinococcus sp.]
MNEGASEDFAADRREVERAGTVVLGAFARMNAAKGEAEQTFAALPRFLRGLAESAMKGEIVRQTGQGLPEWAVTIGGVSAQITAAYAILEEAGDVTALGTADREVFRRAAGEVEHEGAHLGRLLRFMEETPPKIERAPRHLLNNERRRLALDSLRVQSEALREALVEMPTLAQGLQRLSGGA